MRSWGCCCCFYQMHRWPNSDSNASEAHLRRELNHRHKKHRSHFRRSASLQWCSCHSRQTTASEMATTTTTTTTTTDRHGFNGNEWIKTNNWKWFSSAQVKKKKHQSHLISRWRAQQKWVLFYSAGHSGRCCQWGNREWGDTPMTAHFTCNWISL